MIIILLPHVIDRHNADIHCASNRLTRCVVVGRGGECPSCATAYHGYQGLLAVQLLKSA